MSSVQVCVDVRHSPSGRFILSGCRAIFMFVTGVPGKTKWPVAPASAIAMFFTIFNCAVVQFVCVAAFRLVVLVDCCALSMCYFAEQWLHR